MPERSDKAAAFGNLAHAQVTKVEFQETNLIQVNTVQVFSNHGYGSGVILDHTGKIGTAAHIVEKSKNGFLLFLGSTELVVKYHRIALGDTEENDVAILQSEPNLFEKLKEIFGKSFETPTFRTQRNELHPGEVLAISGYPAIPGRNEIEEPPLLTLGIISEVEHPRGRALISATTYKGNSGGPCFTEDGEIVGLVVERWLLGKARAKLRRRKPIEIPTVYSNIFPISTLRVLAKKEGVDLKWHTTRKHRPGQNPP
jgi:S1-C subfamily serine protease